MSVIHGVLVDWSEIDPIYHLLCSRVVFSSLARILFDLLMIGALGALHLFRVGGPLSGLRASVSMLAVHDLNCLLTIALTVTADRRGLLGGLHGVALDDRCREYLLALASLGLGTEGHLLLGGVLD